MYSKSQAGCNWKADLQSNKIHKYVQQINNDDKLNGDQIKTAKKGDNIQAAIIRQWPRQEPLHKKIKK